MSSKTFKVRKVDIAGGGGSASVWAGKLAMWLSIDVLEAIIETGVGHKYLLSIQPTNRKNDENGEVWVRLGLTLNLEKGISICHRLGMWSPA